MSVAIIWSPCFAAGCPICSVQIDQSALDFDPPAGANADIALGFDSQLIRARIQTDLIAVFVGYRDSAASFAVVQNDDVARARSDHPLFDLATADDFTVLFGWRVLAVPKSADHVRKMHITHFKAH